MNVKTIREALRYEARNNLKDQAQDALANFANTATDAEVIRFAQLIGNLAEGTERTDAPPMDSADLARANID